MISSKEKEKYFQLLTEINKNAVQQASIAHLHASLFDTCLGTMILIGDHTGIYFTNFLDVPWLPDALKQLQKRTRALLIDDESTPLADIKAELTGYFSGTLVTFTTPLLLQGTPFQQDVWKLLQKIPCGKTISYATLATMLGKPTAYRAVAQANGANQFCVVIPCHRVISADGSLGGYSSGIERKQWLLTHEQKYAQLL